MRFKTYRQSDEWESKNLNERLRNIILCLDYFSVAKFGKEIVITDIYRTQEEQDEIYKKHPNYKKKPWKSVHQFWRGIDIRSSIFEKEEINELLFVLNRIPYDPKRSKKKTAQVHTVGKGLHFHIQVMGE